MRLLARAPAAIILAASFVTAITVSSPPPALGAGHGDGCSGSWSVVPNPVTAASDLFGVAAVSPSDVWAVGYSWSGTEDQALVEHWDGMEWTVVDIPRPGGTASFLYGVSARSSDDVWAVGYSDVVRSRTLVEHWDGVAWSIVASPNPSHVYNRLFGVAAIGPEDVWAVGSSARAVEVAMIQHWDGSSWRVAPTPELGKWGVSRFDGVSGTGPNDALAVGQGTTGHDGTIQALTEHWNGTAWRLVQPVHHQPQPNYLTGVSAVSSTFALATGARNWSFRTMGVQWDGRSWLPSRSGGVARTINVLNGVSADPAGDAWSVGYYYVPGGSQAQTLVERWDGTSWQIVDSPNQGSTSVLEAVATLSATDAWAVGDWDGAALIEHYCA